MPHRANLLASRGLTAELFRLFGDGEVHCIEEVEARLSNLIPPEIAARVYDRRLRERDRPDVPLRHKVEMGRRWRLMLLLRSTGAKPAGEGRQRWSTFRLLPRSPKDVVDLTDDQIREIRRRWDAKEASSYALAREYNQTRSRIQAIVTRRNYRHVK